MSSVQSSRTRALLAISPPIEARRWLKTTVAARRIKRHNAFSPLARSRETIQLAKVNCERAALLRNMSTQIIRRAQRVCVQSQQLRLARASQRLEGLMERLNDGGFCKTPPYRTLA
jgi:hypothetical protein